jgi:hypothetical protein
LVPLPVTAHVALDVPLVSPLRVTVNVKAVLPLFPSNWSADPAAIDRPASSFRIVPVADDVPSVVPALGFDSVTVNPSSDSYVVSPATLTVTVLLVSPAAKLTVPLGKNPPTKSEPDAAFEPLPATVHVALDEPLVSPLRVTVNV